MTSAEGEMQFRVLLWRARCLQDVDQLTGWKSNAFWSNWSKSVECKWHKGVCVLASDWFFNSTLSCLLRSLCSASAAIPVDEEVAGG